MWPLFLRDNIVRVPWQISVLLLLTYKGAGWLDDPANAANDGTLPVVVNRGSVETKKRCATVVLVLAWSIAVGPGPLDRRRRRDRMMFPT